MFSPFRWVPSFRIWDFKSWNLYLPVSNRVPWPLVGHAYFQLVGLTPVLEALSSSYKSRSQALPGNEMSWRLCRLLNNGWNEISCSSDGLPAAALVKAGSRAPHQKSISWKLYLSFNNNAFSNVATAMSVNKKSLSSEDIFSHPLVPKL
jgi:hypothetical protein